MVRVTTPGIHSRLLWPVTTLLAWLKFNGVKMQAKLRRWPVF